MSADSTHEGRFDRWDMVASFLQYLQHIAIKDSKICPHALPAMQ